MIVLWLQDCSYSTYPQSLPDNRNVQRKSPANSNPSFYPRTVSSSLHKTIYQVFQQIAGVKINSCPVPCLPSALVLVSHKMPKNQQPERDKGRAEGLNCEKIE
jgi:hypothetical protein